VGICVLKRRFHLSSDKSKIILFYCDYSSRMSKRADLEHPELTHPSTKRAKKIDQDTPYDHLLDELDAQESKKDVTKVAHWFRRDLRIQDNISLHAASEQARAARKPLICFYLHCPEEIEWHGLSPARIDFMHETLRGVQAELMDLNVPLVFLTVDKRDGIVPTTLNFLKEHDVSHLFANFEYEVDELRRDIKLIESADSSFHVSLHHDQCVMEPGTMTTGSGGPMKVFTPYHKAWLAEVKKNPVLLNTVTVPSANDSSASKELSALFDSEVPGMANVRQFKSDEERSRKRKLWPAGHEAGMKRMDEFIKDKIEDYAATRSQPAADSTSRMSPYLSAGVVSVREVLSKVKEYNKGSSDFSSSGCSLGVSAWVREVVFRELYRQTTATTPHTSMNLPQNLKFEFVQWEADEEGWKKWYEGKTGVPFVDAGMRQLNHEAYMHNRLRMNVSSYLYCNLLIDYRRGERYFAEMLIDWDLSNNTQGWEPSYTVFNPVSQAEKNDPNGDYIRKWVPELRDVKGKAVFSPHDRLSKEEFDKLGYPEPHVDWSETKARAIQRFKSDMKDAVP
jgi:deoxyribodipyrimidine photo-lyase